MTTADSKRNGPDAGYLLGTSVPMAVSWIGGTGLGYELPLKPGGPLAIAVMRGAIIEPRTLGLVAGLGVGAGIFYYRTLVSAHLERGLAPRPSA